MKIFMVSVENDCRQIILRRDDFTSHEIEDLGKYRSSSLEIASVLFVSWLSEIGREI